MAITNLEEYLDTAVSSDPKSITGVVRFLLDNPRPTDEQVHQWAESNGYTPEEVEEYIYKIFGALLRKIGRSANTPDEQFDPNELAMGIKVEKEHTDILELQKMIAKDHLTECADYYTRLGLLERQCGVSNEGHVDGRLHRELEYTFYGRVADMSLLENAIRKEEHEQWQIPLDTDKEVRTRIRAIDGRRWIMTTKCKYEGRLGHDEVEQDITQDMFNQLKLIAKQGYFKTRYIFKIDGSDKVWEIDVFKDINGKPHPWVKVDLEVTDPNDRKFPKLPLPFVKGDFITHQSKEQDDKEKSIIKTLWSKEWVSLDENQRLGA